jgi:alpha-glucosidase
MQWDSSAFAGFSTAEPWLPLAPNFADENVARESADPGSLLILYKQLLRLRRTHAALSRGRYQSLPAQGDLLLYIREAAADRLLIALNFGPTPLTFSLPSRATARLLLSTSPARTQCASAGPMDLGPNEGIIFQLAAEAAA